MSFPDDPTRPLRAGVAPEDELTGVELDGYRVVRPLGQGGMGRVYEGFDPRLGRRVAIKVMGGLGHPDDNALARFRREVETLAAVNHPNVAQIYSAGSYRGLTYYVMELIEGESLAGVLQEGQRLAGRRCLSYLIDAARGLDAALAKGIVHRDVKPANLMVDASGTLKVVDFGIARRLGEDSSLTHPLAILGTPRYMAPEQILDQSADHRADIYSLGATFYHLFAGEPPFAGEHLIAVSRQHVDEPLTPLSVRNPRVPPSVGSIIGRMMAKRPEDRYQDYRSLIDDLVRVQGGGAGPPDVAPVFNASGTERRIPLGWIALAVLGAGAIALMIRGPGGGEAPPASAQPGKATQQEGSPGSARSGPSAPAPGTVAATAREDPADSEPADRSDPDPPDLPAAGRRAGPPNEALARGLVLGTQANLRNLSNLVEAYLSERGSLPADLDALAEGDEIRPQALEDAWGQPILYEAEQGDHYRLRSVGPDRVAESVDDLVIEDGYFVPPEGMRAERPQGMEAGAGFGREAAPGSQDGRPGLGGTPFPRPGPHPGMGRRPPPGNGTRPPVPGGPQAGQRPPEGPPP